MTKSSARHGLLSAYPRDPAGYYLVRPGDLSALTQEARVRFIDVREPDEFTGELGHIEGAELVPLATLATRSAEWSRQEPIVMVCRSGRRSADAAQLLTGRGFSAVANLVGGMIAVKSSSQTRRTQNKERI